MKMIVKISIVILFIMPSFVNAQLVTYTIKGKVGELEAPAKAYLMYDSAGDRRTDSVNIIHGVFDFIGKAEPLTGAYIIISPDSMGLQSLKAHLVDFYFEPGIISVKSQDSLNNIKIIGGPINTDNEKLKMAMISVNAKMLALDNEYQTATDVQKKSKEFNDELDNRNDSLSREQKAVYLTFIKNNPNSAISLVALENYGGPVPDVSTLEPLFNSLSAEIRESKRGKEYASNMLIMKKTGIGAIAPDFSQTDTAGKLVSLHDFRGKYLLLDFWASWCKPCRAENPNIVKAFTIYHTKGLNILSVSLDQPGAKERWLKAIHDDHLIWTHVSDLKFWANKVAQLYLVRAIPQNFLLDPIGKIIAKNITGDELNIQLKKLIDK